MCAHATELCAGDPNVEIDCTELDGAPASVTTCVDSAASCEQVVACALDANHAAANAVSCCDNKRVPGGNFPMGRCGDMISASCSDGYTLAQANGDTEHQATVTDFYLDTFEVTVGRFRKFVDAYKAGWRPSVGDGAHPAIADSGWQSEWNDSDLWPTGTFLQQFPVPGQPDFGHLPQSSWIEPTLYCGLDNAWGTWTETPGDREQRPMTCASWYLAFAFCIWDGGRLPTEAEWEYAAAGGAQNRLFPWGSNAPDGTHAALACVGAESSSTAAPSCPASGPCAECTLDDLLVVGSRPLGRGRYGHVDLVGNLAEWVFDWHADYDGSACDQCAQVSMAAPQPNGGGGGKRVTRGGSYRETVPALLRSAARSATPPFPGGPNIGFRCARDPS